MSNTVLIVVTGLPGSGKTRLGKMIASRFFLPFICKDEIKESLFDSLGWSDRAWSKRLSVASYAVVYSVAKELLAGRCSFVLESVFNSSRDTQRFREMQMAYEFQLIQIHCSADGETRLSRFKRRHESGERHAGHVDHLNYATFDVAMSDARNECLDIPSSVIHLDTTEFANLDYDALFSTIESLTKGLGVDHYSMQRAEARSPQNTLDPV